MKKSDLLRFVREIRENRKIMDRQEKLLDKKDPERAYRRYVLSLVGHRVWNAATNQNGVLTPQGFVADKV